jgi:hypothetical protein
MDYQFTAVASPAYLHTIGSGAHNAENLRRLLTDTHAAVLAQQAKAVLIELRFVGPSIDLASLYSIILDKSRDALLMKRIAYIDTSTQRLPERAEFAELAANKLGINARAFRCVADAQRWLESKEA